MPPRSRTKAGDLCGVGGYKDFAPDGAFGRSAGLRPAAASTVRKRLDYPMT